MHRIWGQLLQADLKKHGALVGAIACASLITLCYEFVPGLPFFFDDLPIMIWLNHHSLVDIWMRAGESGHYRPLTFTIYKMGLILPLGIRQVALHTVPLLIHWVNTILIVQVVKLIGRGLKHALLAALLFSVHPFLFLALSWVTALPHPLVTMSTLLAVYAALRARESGAFYWWLVSLSAITLAPFAHESGYACGLITGGILSFRYSLRNRELRTFIVGSVLINLLTLLLRLRIPGVKQPGWLGGYSPVENTTYFLHGLIYPIAPVIGILVRQQGWHDFTLIDIAAFLLLSLLIQLARRNGRWLASGIWWWFWGAIPAATSFRFGYLFISPRLHTLSSVGAVMLWAGLIVELSELIPKARKRHIILGLLTAVILAQNISFLHRQRALFISLERVYQQVLHAASEANVPLGFVNVPAWLAYRERVYTLITEGVEFVPPYSDISKFVLANAGQQAVDGVMFTPALHDIDWVFGFRGPGLDWGEMRQFAADHRMIWQTIYEGGRFVLQPVGFIIPNTSPVADPLVRYESGPIIEAASAEQTKDGKWIVTLIWWTSGPVDGDIFVHVHDADGRLVTQADGIWIWQSGDRLYDMRHIVVPTGQSPYTVHVGVYNSEGRLPAFINGTRVPDDAAPVVTIEP